MGLRLFAEQCVPDTVPTFLSYAAFLHKSRHFQQLKCS